MIEKLDGLTLKCLLQKHGFGFSKSLGQNFLCDERILSAIADDADIKKGDTVLEIGPGAGTLTRVMAKRGARVTAVEIDKTLLPVLAETLEGFNAEVINADFLKLDLGELYHQHLAPGFKLVANLPYYITTPIIMRLLQSGLPYDSLTVLVQREVANRMAAAPGTAEYGSLSCAVQYYCIPHLRTRLPAACFFPPPKVESRVITLSRRSAPAVSVHDEKLFFDVMHAAFAMRRKTYANNLMHAFSLSREDTEKILTQCGLDLSVRGEKLSLDAFARIAEFMYSEKSKQHTL